MSDRPGTGRAVLAGALIAGAVLAAYARTFSAPFVFDAAAIVGNNSTIRHLGSALFPPHDGSTVDGRPLVNFSLGVNYAISGTRVWSYHAANVAIHILAAWVLYGIVRRTVRGSAGGAFATAVAVALLWALHPLQTESVTYIAQRAESLMGLFYLLTLYCFVRGAEVARLVPKAPALRPRNDSDRLVGDKQPYLARPYGANRDAVRRRRWFMLAVVACLLGMATKETMVSAPLMVLLFDRTFVAGSFREAWERRRTFYLALATTWVPLGCLVLGSASRHGTAGFGVDLRWSDYALTQVYAVVHYVRLALWPSPLVFDYGTGVLAPGKLIFPAIALLVLLGGTMAGLCARSANARTAGFLGAWFFAILAPTSLVPVATQTIAEHRMYLPLAAVVAALVLALGHALARPIAAAVLACAAAAGLGAATAARNGVYQSDLTLWRDTVAKRPDNDRAHNNFGKALFLQGLVPEALDQYGRALRLHPRDNAEVQYNLGDAFLEEGRLPEALDHCAEAVRLAPANPDARNNLGTALARSGRMGEALDQFQAAARLNPLSAEIHNNLGSAWFLLGHRFEAVAEYREALRIDPGYADARAALDHLREPAEAPARR